MIDRKALLADLRGEVIRLADWLRSAFEVLAASDAGAMLYDQRHNPAYLIPISHDGAKGLLAFWRTWRGDGSLVHDFRDSSWDTRFSATSTRTSLRTRRPASPCCRRRSSWRSSSST